MSLRRHRVREAVLPVPATNDRRCRYFVVLGVVKSSRQQGGGWVWDGFMEKDGWREVCVAVAAAALYMYLSSPKSELRNE